MTILAAGRCDVGHEGREGGQGHGSAGHLVLLASAPLRREDRAGRGTGGADAPRPTARTSARGPCPRPAGRRGTAAKPIGRRRPSLSGGTGPEGTGARQGTRASPCSICLVWGHTPI